MPRRPRNPVCKDCGVPEGPGVPISSRKLCMDCATSRMLLETTELHHHQGDYFDEWRRRLAASIGAELPRRP